MHLRQVHGTHSLTTAYLCIFALINPFDLLIDLLIDLLLRPQATGDLYVATYQYIYGGTVRVIALQGL